MPPSSHPLSPRTSSSGTKVLQLSFPLASPTPHRISRILSFFPLSNPPFDPRPLFTFCKLAAQLQYKHSIDRAVVRIFPFISLKNMAKILCTCSIQNATCLHLHLFLSSPCLRQSRLIMEILYLFLILTFTPPLFPQNVSHVPRILVCYLHEFGVHFPFFSNVSFTFFFVLHGPFCTLTLNKCCHNASFVTLFLLPSLRLG